RLRFHALEGAVHDALGDRLLALLHHRVHKLGDDDLSELGIRIDHSLIGTMTTGHCSSALRFNLSMTMGRLTGPWLPRLAGKIARRRSLRSLGAVLGTALLAGGDALRVEHAANDVVADAGKIFDAA